MDKSKKKKIILFISIILIVGGVTAGGITIKNRAAAKKSAAAKVKEVVVKTDTVSKNITIDGKVAYDDEIKYYANEDDKLISKVLVEVGDFVKKGQTIVEYDMEKYYDLQDDLKKAKIKLETLQLDLENLSAKDEVNILTLSNDIAVLDSGIKDSESSIKNNESQIKQLKAKLVILEKNLKQDKELLDKGYKSATEIKESENAIEEQKDSIDKLTETNKTLKRTIENKKSDKKISLEKLKLAQNKNLDKDVKYQVSVKQNDIATSKIEISAIEKEIKNFQRFTVAENQGVVTSVNVTDGQTVSIGTELLSVADNTKLIINADVSEYEVNKIAVGDKATVSGDGFEKEYTATVTKILPVGEADSDDNIVVPIELSLEKVSEVIRNNYTVSISIVKESKTKSTLVSVSAITKDSSGKSYVNIQNTNTKEITKKEVTTGEIVGTEVEVFGLNTDEKVVAVADARVENNMGPGAGGPPPGGGGPN